MAAPPLWAGVAAAAAPKVVGIGADALRSYMAPKPVPIERLFVDKSVPRNGQAVADMQRVHDQAGGAAPNLDFRSSNGQNEKYAPADRRPAKIPKDTEDAALVASSSSKRPPGDPGTGKVKTKKSETVLPLPIEQAVQGVREAVPVYATRPDRERSPTRGDRRPLSVQREEEAEKYVTIRDKALRQRSTHVPKGATGPEQYYIGERDTTPKNQAMLDAKAGPRARAAKRPAEKITTGHAKRRGGAANLASVVVYEEKQERAKKLRENPRLVEAAGGELKIRKPVKNPAKSVEKADKKIKSARPRKLDKLSKILSQT